MDLKILSPSNLQLPHYHVKLLTPPQPFFHIAIQFTGAFGSINLTKIDLRLCTIWMVGYRINEPLSIQGAASQPFYQLSFRIPEIKPGKTQSLPGTARQQQQPLRLSITDRHLLTLPVEGSQMLCIHYQQDYFKEIPGGNNGNLEKLFTHTHNAPSAEINPNDAILTIIHQLLSASPSHRIVHLYLEAKVKELLVMIYEQFYPAQPASELSQQETEALQQVKNMLTGDLSRSWSLFELARLTGINAFKLKTGFKKCFGIHVHLYQHNCRMEKASQLLLNSTLSIKEIAFQVGYKNVSNFSESFKKYYGYPPSKIREAG